MRRREFIALLGGAATAWPLAADAQQPGKLPTIGFFSAGSAAALADWLSAFLRRLHELGWIEGRTFAIEYRWADGHNERLAEIANEFVRLKIDVIVTHSAAPVIAAKQATTAIPIVFAAAADPVGNGLVASLAQPGGNVTGVSSLTADLANKRLELLLRLVPGIHQLGIIANANAPGALEEAADIQATARNLALEAVTPKIRRASDITPVMDALKGHADALFVVPDPLMLTNRARIVILAAAAQLPTMYGLREYVEAGGLVSYGSNFPDQFRRCAELVDKILRGAKPGDIPVEQPTKFDLVVNLTTAHALRLTLPESFLSLADEVIE